MVEHRMIVRKIEASGDGREYGPQIHAVKLNAGIPFDQFETGQRTHEIVMPERAAHLTVCHCRQTRTFLDGDHFLDGLIFDGFQFGAGAESVRTKHVGAVRDACFMDVIGTE